MPGQEKIKINSSDAQLVGRGVRILHSRCADVHRLVQAAVGISTPPGPLNNFLGVLAQLEEFLDKVDASSTVYVPDELEPIFRTVVQYYRRERARAIEHSRRVVVDAELSNVLEREIKLFDRIIESPGFSPVVPLQIPRLTDFLTIQKANELQAEGTEPDLRYEDKFGVLLAPSLIPSMMGYHRRQCEQRGLPLAVVFLDIDDFKQFNSQHGEPKVDRELLPGFMRLVEKTVFGRGLAFRHGGDECVLLLPNADLAYALFILSRLNKDLARLPFPAMEGSLTISCGVCTLDPGSFLTDSEALEHAANAKKRAKQEGKDCIAGYQGDRFRDEDILVFNSDGSARQRPS